MPLDGWTRFERFCAQSRQPLLLDASRHAWLFCDVANRLKTKNARGHRSRDLKMLRNYFYKHAKALVERACLSRQSKSDLPGLRVGHETKNKEENELGRC